jgi:hypothetical protein
MMTGRSSLMSVLRLGEVFQASAPPVAIATTIHAFGHEEFPTI